MTDTYRLQELHRGGISTKHVQLALNTGQLLKLRHDGYSTQTQQLDPEASHLALLDVTMRIVRPDRVVSHVSAGLIWQLPVPRRLLQRVHVSCAQETGAHIGNKLHVHSGSLTPADISEVGELRVTGLSRTAIDLGRMCRPDEALAVMDAALRLGADRAELIDQVERFRGCRGVVAARWAVEHANALAESPGESMSRYWILRSGLPEPILQFEVRDALGRLLGRADFAWPDHRVLGEFDGRVKYDQLVPDGRTAADVVMAEKRRENAFRQQRWWLVRWHAEDLPKGRFVRALAAELKLEHR